MNYRVVVSVALAGCAATSELGTTEQEVINGSLADPEVIHQLGLVKVNLGCSGVLIANDLVLTAGHCTDPRSQTNNLITFEGVEIYSDRNYVFGGAVPTTSGSLYGIGPDLAVIHLDTPFVIDGSSTGFGHTYAMRTREELDAREVTVYGRGKNSPYGSGEPDVWRYGSMTVGGYAAGWPPVEDLIAYVRNVNAQAIHEGDSGGPTFVDFGGGPELLGIHSTGYVENFCGLDEYCTSVDTYLAPDVWGITMAMEPVWDHQRTTQVFDVWNAEIRTARFVDMDINARAWSDLARMSTKLCLNRGFAGGHANGHQLDERNGLACSGSDYQSELGNQGAEAIDVRIAYVNQTGEGFTNIDLVGWAQAARVAQTLCRTRAGALSGFFTGYQIVNRSFGLTCLRRNAENLTATWVELDATGWRVDGVVQTGYAQAMRAAHGWCTQRGFRTGFLTGKQQQHLYSITCQR